MPCTLELGGDGAVIRPGEKATSMAKMNILVLELLWLGKCQENVRDFTTFSRQCEKRNCRRKPGGSIPEQQSTTSFPTLALELTFA